MERRKAAKKIKVIFVDEVNDLQSQIAEHFLNEELGDLYEGYSAGPAKDFVNCELISVMYRRGYDIRRQRSKDFDFPGLPKKPDYLVFLEGSTYDRLKAVMPWEAKHIVKDFGRKEGFQDVKDDVELEQSLSDLAEAVREWVLAAFADPTKLDEMTQ